jgi:FkbM family methyltransferase
MKNIDLPDINSCLRAYYCSFDAEAVLKRFTPHAVDPHEGLITNFLGVKVTPEVIPEHFRHMTGLVEPPPDPGNWHADIAEWAAALWSVEQAEDSYSIVELGCGWGCWLNNTGTAAAQKGLSLSLIGVEGDLGHVNDARKTLRLNGFREQDCKIIHGIVAAKRGKSFFPISGHHANEWGSQAVFFPDEERATALRAAGQHLELDCFTLAEVCAEKVTDLLHIDIQGAELDFVRGSLTDMNRLVKRCLVGTHSRELDGALFGEFLQLGWRLEMERPTVHGIQNGYPQVLIDGVQLWRNPTLTTGE